MITAFLSALLLVSFQEPRVPETGLRDAVQQKLDAFIAAGKVPGVSVGVVAPDGTELALAAGLADREKKIPMRPDDRLCGGSSGKTFVAAVALQLVEEEKLALDAPLGEYLGEEKWFERLPNYQDITLAHLLGHRTGIARHEFDPEFIKAVMSQPDRVWKPAEMVAYVLDRPPPFAAGKGFAYSDTNFILIGMVIEKVTGKTLYDEIDRRLLVPLKLDGVRRQDSRTLPGLVQGYLGAQNPFGAPEHSLAADGRFTINPQFEWAGGGFVENGGALARWAKALYHGPVLKPATRELMVAGLPADPIGPGIRYGLGCQIWPSANGPCWGHAGFFPGYLTEMRYWPEKSTAVAVQVNTSEYAALPKSLGALCEELLATVLERK